MITENQLKQGMMEKRQKDWQDYKFYQKISHLTESHISLKEKERNKVS